MSPDEAQSGGVPRPGEPVSGVVPQDASDHITQATCQAIVAAANAALSSEPVRALVNLRVPGGGEVGRQVVIDATQADGKANMCRLSVLQPEVAPEGEVVRIEFEHDRDTKFGLQRIYSIQSLRVKAGELVLFENFLAQQPQDVREADFSPIRSESYARATVLKTLQDYTRYRAWQRSQGRA